MNLLKEKLRNRISENKEFYKVLSIALSVNLVLITLLVVLSVSVKDITVTVNGKTASCKTTKRTVDDMLKGWDVNLDKRDVISPGIRAKLKDGTNVDIKLFEVEEKIVKETVAFKTKEEYTSDIFEGEQKVTRKGIKGEDAVTYRITYLGGKEQSRKEVARRTVRKPVTELVAVGTAISYNGQKYSSKMIVVATGYTHTGNRTATGTYPRRGTMAVDRGVIPMGSYGYVPGYGQVHAEDTGGAIKGNRIDLFFETRGQAVAWGRRTVELYIE